MVTLVTGLVKRIGVEDHSFAFGLGLAWVTTVYLLRLWRAQYMAASCEAALRFRRDGVKQQEKALGEVPMDGVYGSAWRVHNLLMAVELKFEAWMAMSARGLFLTYGVPSIATVLHKTGGFDKDTHRRYADMELLIREFNENAPDGCLHFDGQPHRARVAIERINKIHDAYGHMITYRDMMYVLTVFMTTPYLWMTSRWSWRSLTESEKMCIFYHWVDIGKGMGLDVLENFKNLDDVVAYKYKYEAKHMKPHRSNTVVASATIHYFIDGVIWGPLQSVVRPVVHVVMSILQEEPYQSEALGLPCTQWSWAPMTHIPWAVFVLLLGVTLDLVLVAKAVFTRIFLPPLPLSLMDRLVGRRPLVQSSTNMDVETKKENEKKERRVGKKKTKETGKTSAKAPGCPFFATYRPVRSLDFNNKTYTPAAPWWAFWASDTGSGTYSLEEMGPRHIAAGTTRFPKYGGGKAII